MKISLIGYMGSGKSTIAQKLALQTGLTYYDLDVEIEKDTGYTIMETVFNKGELYFRKLEHKKLKEILSRDNFVLATGGGTPCYYNNIEIINKNSLSIFLQVGVMELFARLEGKKSERPLIAHLEGPALQEYIAKHIFERSTFYNQAIMTIKATEKTDDEILHEIKDILHE